MIIYEFTHNPTGKVYIGSKKSNKDYYAGYLSSSEIVSKMMQDNPEEWTRTTLCIIDEDDQWNFQRVVELEQQLIKRRVAAVGWEGVWNRSYHTSGNIYSSSAMEQKRLSLTGRKQSEQEKQAKSVAAHRRYENQEQRDKTSAALKGKAKSASHTLAINIALKSLLPVTCPHCGKTGGRQGMYRYHFDKCKNKETK